MVELSQSLSDMPARRAAASARSRTDGSMPSALHDTREFMLSSGSNPLAHPAPTAHPARPSPETIQFDAGGRRPASNWIVSGEGRAGMAVGAGCANGFEPDESMNSRVSWSAEGIDPSVRERAEAAARRAGMSLNDWLNSTIGTPAPPDFRGQSELPRQEASDVADIHQRLDSITRQIEQISKPAPPTDAPRSERGVARQLNDAISRLDARLAQISNPAPAKAGQRQDSQRQSETVERAAAQVYRASPPLNPASLDFAIAEIAARQSELDNLSPRGMPFRGAPPATPQPGPD